MAAGRTCAGSQLRSGPWWGAGIWGCCCCCPRSPQHRWAVRAGRKSCRIPAAHPGTASQQHWGPESGPAPAIVRLHTRCVQLRHHNFFLHENRCGWPWKVGDLKPLSCHSWIQGMVIHTSKSAAPPSWEVAPRLLVPDLSSPFTTPSAVPPGQSGDRPLNLPSPSRLPLM